MKYISPTYNAHCIIDSNVPGTIQEFKISNKIALSLLDLTWKLMIYEVNGSCTLFCCFLSGFLCEYKRFIDEFSFEIVF